MHIRPGLEYDVCDDLLHMHQKCSFDIWNVWGREGALT